MWVRFFEVKVDISESLLVSIVVLMIFVNLCVVVLGCFVLVVILSVCSVLCCVFSFVLFLIVVMGVLGSVIEV